MMKNTLLILSLLGLSTATWGDIQTTFENVSEFTDFSYSGARPEKTQALFEQELQNSRLSRYVGNDRVLDLTFFDIDLAGDVQPWRNATFSDIRYIESLYPPRMHFRYVLRDSEGNELAAGEEKISDLSFDFGIRPGLRSDPFSYDLEMLSQWAARTLPRKDSQ